MYTTQAAQTLHDAFDEEGGSDVITIWSFDILDLIDTSTMPKDQLEGIVNHLIRINKNLNG